MNEITVRKATLQDIETLLVFEQGVIDAERAFDETLKPHPVHYYNLPEMITAAHIHLMVAECNNEIVGAGYARIENAMHFVKHAQHAFLGFMYTVPAHRGQGVNMKILDALKEWAVQRNMTQFRLEVYADNRPAIRAYEKAGFKSDIIEMRLGLK